MKEHLEKVKNFFCRTFFFFTNVRRNTQLTGAIASTPQRVRVAFSVVILDIVVAPLEGYTGSFQNIHKLFSKNKIIRMKNKFFFGDIFFFSSIFFQKTTNKSRNFLKIFIEIKICFIETTHTHDILPPIRAL